MGAWPNTRSSCSWSPPARPGPSQRRPPRPTAGRRQPGRLLRRAERRRGGHARAQMAPLGRAAKLAAPGDTVHVLAATYRGTVSFYTSGTPAAPIRVVAAEPGVVADAAGAGQALKFMDVSDVEVSGLRVTGATAQGIWVQGGGARAPLRPRRRVQPRRRPLGEGRRRPHRRSELDHRERGAGILELAGTRDARYADNEIRGNGAGGATYNGDGIQLGGTGADVIANTITANGSSRSSRDLHGRRIGGLDDRAQHARRQRGGQRQGDRWPGPHPPQPDDQRHLRADPLRQPGAGHRRANVISGRAQPSCC